ncbi:MAG: NUDIX domain-containing protein [Candidatus Diapherotrites archaeon]|nr:NUDIX domain-containing protein [Candidatus Diapherotrites archaeon]MDZ4256265.1 NUDIX domain-containing protein [archaeon]
MSSLYPSPTRPIIYGSGFLQECRMKPSAPREPHPGKSCGAIVFRGKKVLLLRSTYSHNWGSPQGRMERGENEEQTARREVFEETGLKNIRFLPGFRHVNRYTMYRAGKAIPREVIFFLAESKEGEAIISHEHDAIEWVTLEAAYARVKFRTFKSILRAAARVIHPEALPRMPDPKK